MADCPTVAATLDVTDLRCPLPVLKARKALEALPHGGLLEVLANDPAAGEDFAALCLTTGDQLVQQALEGGGTRFLIRKKAAGG